MRTKLTQFTCLHSPALAAAIIVGLFIGAAGITANAQETTAQEQFDKVVGEYNQAVQAFSEQYQQATTDEERQKASESYPTAQAYAVRLLGLAKAHPTDPVAVDALVWIVTQARFGPENDEAMDILVKNHVQSEKLGPLCLMLVYSGSPSAGALLETLREKSPHREIQGQATYALGMFKAQQQDETAIAEKLFEEVVANYGDIELYGRTLADAAKGDLFEMRNLVVGKLAPEIRGQDVDGVEFALTDYRGKVVVLDFWGDW